MDRNGLLNTLRVLSITCTNIQVARTSAAPKWSWMHTPVLFPESRCAFCKQPIRSPGIWILGGERLSRLYGVLIPSPGGKVHLVQPSHPHDTSHGGGTLCLGYSLSGIDLLASPANLGDCPMGTYRVPKWYKMYWNHDCALMRKYLDDYDEYARLKELDHL